MNRFESIQLIQSTISTFILTLIFILIVETVCFTLYSFNPRYFFVSMQLYIDIW